MFSIKLKELRMQSNLTQRQFAEIMKVSAGTIGNWESGTREPDFAMLKKIAIYFNVSANYLLDIENTQPKNSTDTEYNAEEKQLIEDYRSLTPELKKMITETMKTFTNSEINTSAKRKKI